jgi:hypothetical protein
MSNTGVVMMGLSLIDGSIVSSVEIPKGAYFDMFRIENDCFEAFPTRVNPAAHLNILQPTALEKGFYWLTLELTEGPQTMMLQKD